MAAASFEGNIRIEIERARARLGTPDRDGAESDESQREGSSLRHSGILLVTGERRPAHHPAARPTAECKGSAGLEVIVIVGTSARVSRNFSRTRSVTCSERCDSASSWR
jgi:hypothetical protein